MISPFGQKEHERDSPFGNLLPPVVLADDQLHIVVNLLAPLRLQDLLVEVFVPVEERQH
jgi:hypothetical protein